VRSFARTLLRGLYSASHCRLAHHKTRADRTIDVSAAPRRLLRPFATRARDVIMSMIDARATPTHDDRH
jgi:hypothetical protein